MVSTSIIHINTWITTYLPTLRDGRLTHIVQFTHKEVTCQPRIGRRAGKVRRPKTNILTTELRRVYVIFRLPSKIGILIFSCALLCRSLATLSVSDPKSVRGVRHLSSNSVSTNDVAVLKDAECRRLAGLTRRQRRVCRRNAENMAGVRHGAKLAIDECQHQFQHRRWNCSVVDRVNVFEKVVVAGIYFIFLLKHPQST